jgi:hypothetical protein
MIRCASLQICNSTTANAQNEFKVFHAREYILCGSAVVGWRVNTLVSGRDFGFNLSSSRKRDGSFAFTGRHI